MTARTHSTLDAGQIACAEKAIARCRRLAGYTEEPGFTTRTFLSEPMRGVHRDVREWMEQAGMRVSIDAAGNIRGVLAGRQDGAPRLVIGSHLDTVPRAGAFDGILGVILGISLVEALAGQPLNLAVEVIGFSEEEGVRFGVPFLGSRAVTGGLDATLLARRDASGVSIEEAIRSYGLDPSALPEARLSEDAVAYLEIHIEQGPILESLDLPLGIVEAIAGQSRFQVTFTGSAGHAGTTPMHLRKDALAAAAEWISTVEREALATAGLVATVGSLAVQPGAANVIAGEVRASLDVRHAGDEARKQSAGRICDAAAGIASRRGLAIAIEPQLDQAAVAMDPFLRAMLARAVEHTGVAVHAMQSGAGHDAMIVARKVPSAMLFLRSPGGLSHHPAESVLLEDVAAALAAARHFVTELSRSGKESRNG